MSQLRPLHDGLLIRVDPIVDKYLISSPDIQEQAGVNAWGTVIAAGPGRWTAGTAKSPPVRVLMDVKVGDRVCFIRYHARTKTGEGLAWVLGKDKVLLKEADVIVYEPAEAGSGESAT